MQKMKLKIFEGRIFRFLKGFLVDLFIGIGWFICAAMVVVLVYMGNLFIDSSLESYVLSYFVKIIVSCIEACIIAIALRFLRKVSRLLAPEGKFNALSIHASFDESRAAYIKRGLESYIKRNYDEACRNFLIAESRGGVDELYLMLRLQSQRRRLKEQVTRGLEAYIKRNYDEAYSNFIIAESKGELDDLYKMLKEQSKRRALLKWNA